MADLTAQQIREMQIKRYILGVDPILPDVAKLESRPFIYAMDTDTQNGVQLASGQAANLQIQIDDGSYFLVEQIHIISGLKTVSMDKALVQITDTTTSRAWSDQPVPLRDIAGRGDAPKYLSDPNLLRPTSTLNVQITNNTGSSAAFYAALIGRKIIGLSEAQANIMLRRLWFTYVMNLPSGLGASAVDTQAQVKIYNESDFILKKLSAQQMISAWAAASGGALSDEIMVMLRDTTADRNFMNQKLPLRLIAGQYAGAVTSVANSWAGGSPETLKKPALIRRNGILAGFFDNKSTTAVTGPVNLTCEGIRVFDQA
ncbi:MAG TPA: hypothetical protein VN915_06775 [Elusimicrobiota bacterium]|nr:hypothetical protein [Elusimicrobiota bacterium]